MLMAHRKNKSHFSQTATESQIHYSTKYKNTFFGLVSELVHADVVAQAAYKCSKFTVQKSPAVTQTTSVLIINWFHLVTPIALK